MTQGFTTVPVKHTILDANLHTDTKARIPVAGDMIYASGAGLWEGIGIGTSNQVLTVLSGRPAWQAAQGGTHNLLSTTHPDTLPASPVRGDLIVANLTPVWNRLPVGASGNIVQASGAATDTVFSAYTMPLTIPADNLLATSVNFGGGANQVAGISPNASSVTSYLASSTNKISGWVDPRHNLLSQTHLDTTPAAGVRGDIIVFASGGTTSTWGREAIGAVGSVLRSDGTDPTWQPLRATDLPAQTLYYPVTTIAPSGGGNAFFNATQLTNYVNGHWEFVKSVDGEAYGQIRIPDNIATVPSGAVVLSIGANATSGVTVLNCSYAVVADGASMNPSLTADTAQNVAVPSTARNRKDVTFTGLPTLTTSGLLIVRILHQGSSGSETLAVNTELYDVQLRVRVNT